MATLCVQYGMRVMKQRATWLEALAIVKDVGMKIQKYKGELVSIPVCSVSKPVGALFRSHKYQQAFSTDLKMGVQNVL